MTSETDTKAESELPLEGQDMLLELIVRLVEKSPDKGGWPITLAAGGFLISGYICSAKSYLSGIDAEFGVEKVFGRLLPDDNDRTDSGTHYFIHLRDARFFNTVGNPIPGNRGVWWRGRLSEVVGFNFGTLETSQQA